MKLSSDKQKTDAVDDGGNDREIDLREYLGILLDNWHWIVAGAVIGLLIGIYYAWSPHPQYQATSLMRIQSPYQNMAPQAIIGSGSGSGGSGYAGGGGLSEGRVNAEASILKSRSVVRKAVRAKHLEVSVQPDYFPKVGAPIAWLHHALASGVWSLGGYAWGNAHAKVTRFELPDGVSSAYCTLVAGPKGRYSLRIPDGGQFLSGRVGQSEQGKMPGVGVIHIFVRSLHAAPGTRFHVRSMALSSAVASLRGRIQTKETSYGSGLLRLKLTASSPQQAESRLNAVMNAYMEQNVAQQSKQAQKRLTFLQKQLPHLRQQRNAAQQKLAKYQSKTGNLDIDAQAQATLSRLTKLDQKIEEVKIHRQQLLQEYTAKAPQVKAANAKINTLKHKRDQLQEQLNKLPGGQSRFLRLKRNAKVKDQIYTQMLNTAQSLKVRKAGVTGNAYIVDKAYSNGAMVAPRRKRIEAVGLLLGAVLATLLVITRALLRTTVDEPKEIESRFGLSVYATVPFAPQEKNKRVQQGPGALLVQSAPDAPAAESFRSLRTSLEFALMEAGTRFMAITGPTPQCGKTFVATNVAALLAESGMRVLLVDADMRRGSLYRQFGVQRSPGLSEVLAGEVEPASVRQPSGIDNLDLLTTGKRPPNPSELLLSRRFAELKQALDGHYDYVLFDLPPVLNVTDPNIVSHHATATFLVVRSEHSTADEVDQALRRFKNDGLKTTGVIFNGLHPERRRYGYGKYGYYGYRYR